MKTLNLKVLLSSFLMMTASVFASNTEEEQNNKPIDRYVLNRIGFNHSSSITVTKLSTVAVIQGGGVCVQSKNPDTLKLEAADEDAIQVLTKLFDSGVKIKTPPKKRGRSHAMMPGEKNPFSIQKTSQTHIRD